MSSNKSILVTGASSGIGAELSLLYAKSGFNATLFARREDRLQEVVEKCRRAGNGQTEYSVGDVRNEDDLKICVEKIKNQFGRLDVVVANAGFGVAGRVSKLSMVDFRRQFETNVFGVLNTIYAVLDLLKESKGSLVLMGSVNSYVSQSGFSAYCMSKAAIKALADSLHKELAADGIAVTLVCPGVVESEIYKIDNEGVLHEERKDRRPAILKVSTEKAAFEIKKAIDSRKREAIITGHGKLFVKLQRHAPWLMSQIAK